MKIVKVIIFLGMLIISTVAVGKSSNIPVEPKSGDWMCMAVAEKILGSNLNCDATGVDMSKGKATNKAIKKCNKDCPTRCKLEVCVYIR